MFWFLIILDTNDILYRLNMNILYGAYTMVSGLMILFGFCPFLLFTRIKGKYRGGLKERLGCISKELTQSLSGSPRIWIHAVSLGEVRVAASVISALRRIIPDCSIILSTTTEHGRDLAMDILDNRVLIIYGPVDFILFVRKALQQMHPDLLVFLETEIWPAWITEAHRMGIKILLINGRISLRSLNWYRRFRFFFHGILGRVDIFSMRTEEDRSRVIAMGADPRKTRVNGNAKYDLLYDLADPAIEAETRKMLNIEASCPVLIAGSTRRGEEVMVIKAYEKILEEFPDMVLLIAPRHIERTGEIASFLESQGIQYQLRSEIDTHTKKRSEKVILINTFGELFRLYSVGTIIFCGASLVPLGGQNPLEAAAWGKAVLYGPFMDDFLDAKAVLNENDAGIQVSNPEMLADRAIQLLKNPGLLHEYGARARQAVRKNQKVAERHAQEIVKLAR